MASIINGGKNFTILLILSTFVLTLFESKVKLTQALNIEPNHDRPCVVGDAWAEECMSCICLEGRIATCKPSFCATRLKRELDDCKNGEITKIDCNTCECKNNVKICTKYDCGKSVGDQRHVRKSIKKKDRRLQKRTKAKN